MIVNLCSTLGCVCVLAENAASPLMTTARVVTTILRLRWPMQSCIVVTTLAVVMPITPVHAQKSHAPSILSDTFSVEA